MSDDRKALRALTWFGIPFVVIGTLAVLFIIANRPPVVHVPSHKLPKPNGWDDFVAAAALLNKQASRGPYSTKKPASQWTTREIKAWLPSALPALQAMRQGLNKQCMHPQARSNSDYRSSFTPYSRFRELARISAGSALYYDRTGEPDRAVDLLLDAVEFGVTIPRGGPLMASLVGTATEFIPTTHIEPLLPKLTPAELAAVARRMQEIGARRVPFADCIREEGSFNAALLVETFTSERSFALNCDTPGFFAPAGTSTSGSITHSVSFAFTSKAKIINQHLAYMEALAKEQSGPYTGRSSVRRPANLCAPLTQSIARGRFPSARNEAMFALFQTEVALLQYRAENGRYPDKLAELAPKWLKKVPLDPFGNGKPLHYQMKNGGRGYLLYSFGPDLRDDSGKPVSVRRISIGSQGDIVAGHLSHNP